MATHFAKMTFGASTWSLQLLDMWLFRKDYDTICELTFDCPALVALSIAFVSRLGCAKLVFARILCSTRECMIYVHGRHLWVQEAGVRQQVIIRAVRCSRSSVIPGCGVLTT